MGATSLLQLHHPNQPDKPANKLRRQEETKTKMKETRGDLFELYDQGKTIAITTNGYIRKDGCAVMGRGVAYQAKVKFRGIERTLGKKIKANGNVVQFIIPRVLAFPVKPEYGIADKGKSNVVKHMRNKFYEGDEVPGWAMVASLDRIGLSLADLWLLYDQKKFDRVYMPRAGCGAGELNWRRDVRPLISKMPDWVYVVEYSRVSP